MQRANCKSQRVNPIILNSGAVSLVTVLVLGIMIVEIALASAALVILLTSASVSTRLSEEALTAAQSGVSDMLLRLVRKESSCVDECTVSFFVGANSVMVKYTKNTALIESVGQSLTKKRKLNAIIDIDSVTGAVRLISLSEGTLP